jgi:signal transduction histidine kinase
MILKQSITRRIKIIIILLLVILSVLLVINFHYFFQTGTVFTHFLYIPIILSCLWWGRKGFGIAVFLALLLALSNIFLRIDMTDIDDYIRSVMFVIIGFIVAMLSERIKTQEEKKNQALTETGLLQKEIMQTAEKERQRIGQDLHDGIGQNLTAVTFLLEAVRDKLIKDNSEAAGEIEGIEKLVKKSIVQTRSISKILFPVKMDRNGFYSAVTDMISSIEKVFDVSCRITGEIDIEDNQTAVHLYYIVREAVTNAIKHGRAKNINIILTSNLQRKVFIIDDGIGAKEDEMNSGMGLRIMKYRADLIGAAFFAGNGAENGFEVRIAMI